MTKIIPERKRAEEAISHIKRMETGFRRSEERFKDFAEAASDWFWEMDENLKFIFHSERYFEITGFRLEDKIGATRTRYVDPSNLSQDAEKWDAHKADLEARRSFKNFEYSFKVKDGSLLYVRISGIPFFDDNGVFRGYRGTGTDITERVEAEEATSRLVAAIEGLSENFALYGPDEKMVICNRNYRRLNEAIPETTKPGILFEDHVRAVVEKGLAPQSLGREEEWVQQRLARFRNPGKQFEIARQDGRWFLAHEQRMLDGSTATIATDITERKRIEEALKESEERFRSVIDNFPAFITLKDADGRFQLVNRKHVEMFGLEPPDIVGKNSFDLYPEKLAEEATAHDRKVLETKSATTKERQISTKQGTRDFLITKFPVLDGSGDVVRIGTIGTDITDRKRAEKTQERLTQAIENIPVGIALFDGDDRLVFCNNRYAELMDVMADILKPGVTFEEMIRTIVDRQPVKDARGREEEFIRERVELHRNPTGPIDIRREDKWLMANETRLPDGGIFTIISDVTEQKQAEEDRRKALVEAEQANRTKSEFLAAMSHDLRTPLNAILGFADILSGQYFGPISDKYQEYATDIHSSGEHLLALVNDILDLSTIEAGKQSVVKEKLSTEEIVTECERIVEDKARSNGIDLVTEFPKDLPPLYADRRAVKQILLNLLSNAVKFTPQGGKITVSVKASKKNTTLKVADTGMGIPADKLLGLTDPFTRAERDPYLAEQGWGLGLTITKSLVELHDGTLDIKSTLGKGTTVTVTLPNSAP